MPASSWPICNRRHGGENGRTGGIPSPPHDALRHFAPRSIAECALPIEVNQSLGKFIPRLILVLRSDRTGKYTGKYAVHSLRRDRGR